MGGKEGKLQLVAKFEHTQIKASDYFHPTFVKAGVITFPSTV
jgi:hypothetical protein